MVIESVSDYLSKQIGMDWNWNGKVGFYKYTLENDTTMPLTQIDGEKFYDTAIPTSGFLI